MNKTSYDSNLIYRIFYIIIIILFLQLLIKSHAMADPFQLIESESAVVNDKGNLEFKNNYAYEFGHIPVHLNMYRFRYGLFSRFEFGINFTIAHFPDQKDTRVSEVGTTMKAHIYKQRFSKINLFLYAHYRHAYWGSKWQKIVKDIYISPNRTKRIVSPHADEGMDATTGFLMRHSYKIRKKRFYYLVGLTYTYHHERDYGDFKDNQHSEIRLNFSPEIHMAKNKIMMALENQIGIWINRGFYYIVVPQIRFEPKRFLCIELGAVLPVVAAENYRVIGGFTYGFYSDFFKKIKRKKYRKKRRSKRKRRSRR